LVTGRDALLRVFYSAPADRVGDSVRVVLELDGGAPIESEARLSAASVAGDLATTANVPIPGDRIGAVLSYRVSIVEEADSDDGGDNPNARHPERGLETHVVDAEQNTLRSVGNALEVGEIVIGHRGGSRATAAPRCRS
jgi:hypothetical protein